MHPIDMTKAEKAMSRSREIMKWRVGLKCKSMVSWTLTLKLQYTSSCRNAMNYVTLHSTLVLQKFVFKRRSTRIFSGQHCQERTRVAFSLPCNMHTRLLGSTKLCGCGQVGVSIHGDWYCSSWKTHRASHKTPPSGLHRPAAPHGHPRIARALDQSMCGKCSCAHVTCGALDMTRD